MHCQSVRKRVLATLAAAATVLIGASAYGQVATDFPTYKGNNARQGHANDVGPGQGSVSLRWYTPSSNLLSSIVDNTDLDLTDGFGTVSTTLDGTSWFAAASTSDESSFAYYIRLATGEVGTPGYLMARAAATPTLDSSGASDPTVAVPTNDLKTFEWRFTIPTGASNHFAPYVWLPTGPTTVGGVKLYPQRYFVYQVLVNGVLQFNDVVDTYNAGTGWVRLGASGAATNRVINVTVGDVVTIRLLNTMTRGSDGKLTMSYLGTKANPTDKEIANSYVVYADAAEIVATEGYMVASPTVMTVTRGTETIPQVVAARNDVLTGTKNGVTVSVTDAVISAYRYNGGTATNSTNDVQTYWTQSLAATSGSVTAVDNNPGGVLTGTGFVSSTASGVYNGVDYYAATLTTGDATGDIRYEPTLSDGEYEIWAYLSGDQNSQQFGTTTYEIHEGTTVTSVDVDQNQTGWVRIGSATYTNSSSEPLDVRVTNHTSVAVDAGKLAYADTIRFIGQSDISVTSTPVQAVVNIRKWVAGADGKPQLDASGNIVTQLVATPVVVVADSQGVLHCLDAIGNADGTTTTYWTYPSFRDQSYSNWVDPNVIEEIDGVYHASQPASSNVVTAVMPTSFDTTSAVVQRVNGVDYLYIGSQNGRVYCINMSGRGDYGISRATYDASNLDSSGKPSKVILNSDPGTARRRWTYPTDPLDDSTITKDNSLGPIVGSVTYADTTNGPTLFVPDSNGRIYALDALGNGENDNSKYSVKHATGTYTGWPYPALTAPTLGKIVSTPTYEFGKLYFGTMMLDGAAGQLYALADDGTEAWTHLTAIPGGDSFSDFRCSLVTAPDTAVGDTGINYLYGINDNGHLFALNADTGALLWDNTELSIASRTTLGFTNIGVNIPVVTVSGSNGRFAMYRAHRTLPTGATSRVSIQRRLLSGDELTPVAFATGQVTLDTSAKGWLYFGSRNGVLYAFADSSAAGSNPDPSGQSPFSYSPGIDDAQAVYYSKAKYHYITASMYRKLQGLLADRPDYSTGTTTEINAKTTFDWGETVYLLVYDYPYMMEGDSNPPTINLELSVDGKVIRTLPASSMQFVTKGAGNPPTFSQALPVTSPVPDPDPLMNGYAIAQFTFQGGGQNALPPGPGHLSISITTGGDTNANPPLEISLPNDPATRNGDFSILNPIGLSVDSNNPLNPNLTYAIGFDPNGTQTATGTNGSPDVGTNLYSRLASTTGLVPMGQTGTTRVYVYDRSLMYQIRPPGIGLDNVRVLVNDLKWQNGEDAILSPLADSIYPAFEDKPINYPNTSSDYPDIGADRIAVTKDPSGSAENPKAFKVRLTPPTVNTSGTRVLVPTPFDFSVDAPKYQPPNMTNALGGSRPIKDSGGNVLTQGYFGKMSVFVDSLENGLLDTVAAREAYRSFNLMTNVAPSQQIFITTPTINLGSLATGTGYAPLSPDTDTTGKYNPWSGDWRSAYQTFGARNEGNVNLLNVRLALRYAGVAWPFVPTGNDPLAWLNGGFDLWSDLNAPFAPANPYDSSINRVILPKPRVEDRTGIALLTNPISRITQQALNKNLTPAEPKLAVSVPLGFPSGSYTAQLRLIEDLNGDYNLDVLPNTLIPSEPASSESGLVVNFNVRESRITTRPTDRTAPVVENLASLVPAGGVQAFPFANLQPAAMRDPRGALLMAWTSNRPARAVTAVPDTPSSSDDWRIFIGSVANAYTTRRNQASSPLWDLNQFLPDSSDGNRWVSDLSPNGYPVVTQANVGQLFAAQNGETITSPRFHSPAFPVTGSVSLYETLPSNARLKSNSFLAFVGDATVTSGSDQTTRSMIFIAPVALFANGRIGLPASPIPLLGDLVTQKGRPTVVPDETGSGATVFYAGTSGGSTGLFWAHFDGTKFGQAYSLDVGPGFDTVAAPNALARAYQGANTAQYGARVVDLAFEGKLRGRKGSEIYLGRVPIDANGIPTRFAYLPLQTNERMVLDSPGVYRARGLVWDTTGAPISIMLRNVSTGQQTLLFEYDPRTGVLDPPTAVFDRKAGLVSVDSKLGGKLTIDPGQGTVRMSSATVPQGAELLASYRPAYLRSSTSDTGGPGYVSPNVLFDDHYVTPDILNPAATRVIPNWYLPNGTVVRANTARPANHLTYDRYLLFYNRGSAAAGQAARPLMNTMRLGVRLPYNLTDGSGNALRVTVSGATGPYEVDPARNRVYFTALDEDREVTVSVQGATYSGNVGIVQETDETEVPIEQAANESGLTAFVDPLYSTGSGTLRPSLVWLFWTSTRAGNPDVYFQTIAPHIAPGVRAP